MSRWTIAGCAITAIAFVFAMLAQRHELAAFDALYGVGIFALDRIGREQGK